MDPKHFRSIRRRAVLVAFGALLQGTAPALAERIVLANDAIELRFDVGRGQHGHLMLTRIRDLVAGRDWLALESPLFEFSFADAIWRSDDLPVSDVRANDTELIVSGDLFRPPDIRKGHAYTIVVKLRQGEPVARVRGVFSNGDDDWFGPFTLGDKGNRPVPVFPLDANVVSVRTDERSEEVFVVGFDGIVYGSREQDDGAFATPAALYSTADPALRNLFPTGAPLAAVRRDGRQIDVFAVGNRGDIKTVFRRDGNPFSAPLSLTPEGFFASGSPLAALTVHEETDAARNVVEVYAVQDSSGQLYMIREDNDGAWSAPQLVTVASPRLGLHVHVAALQRNTRQRDLFVVNGAGNLITTFRILDGPWSPFVNLSANQPGLLPVSAHLAAVNGKGDDEHVFAVGNDRRLYWSHEEQDGAWTPLVAITEPLDAVPGAGVSAVHRTGREIVVAVPLRSGAITVLSKVHDAPAWRGPSELEPARKVAAVAKLSATMRDRGQLDLFYVSKNDGRLWTSAAGAGDVVLRTVFPKILFTGPAELRGALGMVAQEIGAVAPLRPSDEPLEPVCGPSMCRTLGMPYASDGIAQFTGLPEAMNSLEVASVTRDGSTLFFADLSGNLEAGRAPIQMTLSSTELAGLWEASVHGGRDIDLPEFAIGVAPGGTWRNAVDYYVGRHRGEWSFPDTPSWLREAGAIYTFGAGGAGGIYLELALHDAGTPARMPRPANRLPGDLGNYASWFPGTLGWFQNLVPWMFGEARALGTDVVYLWDYWDFTGTCMNDLPIVATYFCKGDYRVRGDLGGVDSLRTGIDTVHGYHGKVILYVEPFIIGAGSDVFNQYRDLWGSRLDGVETLFQPFGGDSLAMSQAMRHWQDRVVDITTRLVRDTGADGIFLDSGGWRMNLRPDTWQEVVGFSTLEHAQGFLELADRVRREIRKINPLAVVLTETTAGPIGRHVDGGVSADFHHATPAFTGAQTVGSKLIASPVRYGVPQINFFSNGQNLSQMNQVFAAGQSLALSSNWIYALLGPPTVVQTPVGVPPGFTNFMRGSANYIKRLVEARKNFADALVYGAQLDQPTTEAAPEGARRIVAYGYAGAQRNVITVVNLDSGGALVGLKASSVLHPGDVFCDAVSGDQFVASTLPLLLVVPPAPETCVHDDASRPVCGLRVLVRKGPNEICG